MADITPTDIVNKEFRRTLNGYDRHAVDDFLQQVSDSLYHALEESQRLRAQLTELTAKLQDYQGKEGLIHDALVLAERTADELRQSARQDADLIRREAEVDLRRERAELEAMRQSRYRSLAELRGMLVAHLAMLDAQEKPPEPVEREDRVHGV